MKLTSKKVQDYMLWRTDEELRQCPEAIATACNDIAEEYSHNAKDLLKLIYYLKTKQHLKMKLSGKRLLT